MELLGRVKSSPHDKELRRGLLQEMRMFGAIARARFRDRSEDLCSAVRSLGARECGVEKDARNLCHRIEQFVTHVAELMEKWRELRWEVHSRNVSSRIREGWAYLDEYLSVVAESKLTRLIRVLDKADVPDLNVARQRARRLLLSERDYREGVPYDSVIADGVGHNEHYVYRRGMLKKFVQSVLWLEVSKEKEGGSASNAGAMIAAATAMAVTLALTIFHTQWFLINTWGFVIAGTLTYVLKDRIKDWLKHYLSARFSRWLSDYKVRIRDPDSGEVLGTCREAFSYMSAEDVPRGVMELRHAGRPQSIEADAKPEVILRYQKDVCLLGRPIVERMPLEDYNVNDIMRFGVQEFLVRADDPETRVATYDAREDRVKRRFFPKVYHLNVVMVLRSDAAPDQPLTQRLRVIFDKSGIRRLEPVY